MAQNRSFMIPMFHRTGSISLSQTSVSLVNQNPVTEIPSAQVSVTALNSNIIEYNFPLHSDTTYHGPIPLTSSYTIPSLDSGKNIIQFRFIGNSFHDTIYLRKVIYFLPGVLKNIYTDNQIIWGDSTSLGSKILVDGNFYKTNSSVIDSVRLIKGAHYIEFKKYGYHEGLYSRDSVFPLTGVHLDTITYSSLADSAFFDFTVGDKNNFWKTISVLDSAQQSKISVRQFNKNLSILGLITKSRLYDFRHLNTTWSNVRFASELDQKENLSVNSVYLLKISDGVRYEKIAFDTISHRAEYDSAVQKLSYNFINFDSGTAATEALVIIKKQAPVLRSVSTINIAENGALVVPLSLFFSDPDSISNDMTYSFVSTSPAGLSLSISNDSVVIRANHCYSGSTSFTINATHDWLIKSNSINVHVSSNAGIITGTSSLCVGSTTVLSNAKTGGMWSSNDTSVVDIDNSGVIVARAKGTAIISYKKTSGGCTDIATKTVTVNGIAGPITGPTAVCLTHTIQLYDTEPGGAWGSDDFTIILPSSSGQMIATGPGIANITHTVTNSCGISSASHAITVYPEENCITNVSGTANLNLPELKIFPNPNTGTFTVTLISNRLEQMDIKITNLLGQKVKEFTSVTNQATFIKLNEVSGIYFLSARTPSGSYSAKMTIE